jgi:flagellar motor protein MotB
MFPLSQWVRSTLSMSDDTQQPIVVKKIKKGGGGAHGGAWKIAYADFVTAMMAFFLLMWLLGSTAQGDLQGISDFFNSPLKVAMSGGSGAGDATSPIAGGGQDLTRSVGQVKRGDVDGKRSMNIESAKGATKPSGDEGAEALPRRLRSERSVRGWKISRGRSRPSLKPARVCAPSRTSYCSTSPPKAYAFRSWMNRIVRCSIHRVHH